MLGKEKEAEEFANFLQSKIDFVEERVKDIKPEERKRVYWEDGHWDYHAWGVGIHIDDLLDKAGGINIFADIGGSCSKVDPEEIRVKDSLYGAGNSDYCRNHLLYRDYWLCLPGSTAHNPNDNRCRPQIPPPLLLYSGGAFAPGS